MRYKPYDKPFTKLSLEDFAGLFMTPRDDHPGRKGSVIPRRGSGSLNKGQGTKSPHYLRKYK